MASQSKAQKKTVERVMHDFKEGGLEQRNGEPVKNPRQAIAIALSEAGASNREKSGRTASRRPKAKAGARKGGTAPAAGKARGGGEASKADLYAEAKKRGVPGRSRMTKDELLRALH